MALYPNDNGKKVNPKYIPPASIYEKYFKQVHHLINKYGIHYTDASCYVCNFPNDYICYQFNGGCKCLARCQRIRDEEGD